MESPLWNRFTVLAVWIVRVLGASCAIATLLPLLPTGFWWVRGWDFPRLQVAVLLFVILATAVVCRGAFTAPKEFVAWLSVLGAACAWQVSHVVRFTAVWPDEIRSVSAEGNTFRLLVVNLNYENDAHAAVIAEIRDLDPDVLILIEVDEAWHDGLSSLRTDYEYHHDEIRGDGLGLCLWSKLRLQAAETEFLVEDRRPSIWAQLVHSESLVNLVAVHPTPPGLRDATGESRRDSRVRDAELVLIAKQIAERQSEAWIVAGDFNDVAWSHTTRLFKRLSGLKDPRIGRTYMGTYPADFPLLSFPIDHVFLSDGFAVADLSRHGMTGSDHFGVSAVIAWSGSPARVTPEPEGDDRDEASEIVEEGIQDAKERGVLSND